VQVNGKKEKEKEKEEIKAFTFHCLGTFGAVNFFILSHSSMQTYISDLLLL